MNQQSSLRNLLTHNTKCPLQAFEEAILAAAIGTIPRRLPAITPWDSEPPLPLLPPGRISRAEEKRSNSDTAEPTARTRTPPMAMDLSPIRQPPRCSPADRRRENRRTAVLRTLCAFWTCRTRNNSKISFERRDALRSTNSPGKKDGHREACPLPLLWPTPPMGSRLWKERNYCKPLPGKLLSKWIVRFGAMQKLG